jgi:hypothetical protein
MSVSLSRPHAIAFLDLPRARPVEDLRARWDPVTASQVAAHVTFIYPEEVRDSADLERRAVTAAASTAPFGIALGPAFCAGSPADGVFLGVEDLDGGIASFRAAALQPGRMIDFPLHVTIVHPRTSDRGPQAWDQLAGTSLGTRFTITQVAVTAFAGDHWETLRLLPLGRPPPRTGPQG